jgi:hypothetical protein
MQYKVLGGSLMRRLREELWGGVLFLLAVFAAAALAEESAITPPKADVPYLLHAGNLVEAVHTAATEERKKDTVTYVVPGATSTTRTPLAGPEFVFLSEKLDPNTLRLYGFTVRNGRREISFNEKKRKQNPEPHVLSVIPVSKGLFKVRVDGSLERGEYCLTPDGSNDVYCFTVF